MNGLKCPSSFLSLSTLVASPHQFRPSSWRAAERDTDGYIMPRQPITGTPSSCRPAIQADSSIFLVPPASAWLWRPPQPVGCQRETRIGRSRDDDGCTTVVALIRRHDWGLTGGREAIVGWAGGSGAHAGAGEVGWWPWCLVATGKHLRRAEGGRKGTQGHFSSIIVSSI